MYVVRRRLGFTWDEWRALPWWQAQAYKDGLEAEFSEDKGKSGSDDKGQDLTSTDGVFVGFAVRAAG